MLQTAKTNIECKLGQGIIGRAGRHKLYGFVNPKIGEVGRKIHAKVLIKKLCEKAGRGAAIFSQLCYRYLFCEIFIYIFKST